MCCPYSVYQRLDYFYGVFILQQLSTSSIVPCEESETQLCIANSLEVRSDEICAESVLSADDAVLQLEAMKGNTADGNLRPRSFISKQHATSTVVDNTGICGQPQARRHTNFSSNQKPSHATSSGDADCFHHKSVSTSHCSDAETDAGDKHICPVLKNVCHPGAVDNNSSLQMKQEEILKLSLQV